MKKHMALGLMISMVMLCFSSCNLFKHEHVFVEWHYDETHHWKELECPWNICDINPERLAHVDENGDDICDDCVYEMKEDSAIEHEHEDVNGACSCGKEIDFDNLSDKEFFSMIKNYKNSVCQSLYTLNGETYGRIISSSSSKENAVAVCTRHFTDERYAQAINTVIECNVIYESDILYGINVKWEVTNRGEFNGQYEENVISFKKSVADVTVRNVVYNDVESYRIYTNQEEQINQILLYLFHHEHFLHFILHYETTDYENERVLTIYYFLCVRGDFDMKDKYMLFKSKIVLSKGNGDVQFQEQVALNTCFL